MNVLKPCPFDGGKALITKEVKPDWDGLIIEYVRCSTCGIRRSNVERWNARADDGLTLPEGWNITFLGKDKKKGDFVAQLRTADPDDDGMTFISRTGPTATAALTAALAKIEGGRE